MYPQSLEWVIRQPNFSGTIPAADSCRSRVLGEAEQEAAGKSKVAVKLWLDVRFSYRSAAPLKAGA
jgi:hypothetical protein